MLNPAIRTDKRRFGAEPKDNHSPEIAARS